LVGKANQQHRQSLIPSAIKNGASLNISVRIFFMADGKLFQHPDINYKSAKQI
jgi:hypothetical protein